MNRPRPTPAAGRRRAPGLLLALAGLGLAGCFSTEVKEENFYALKGPPLQGENTPGPTLLVDEFAVAAGYEKARMAYRLSEHELRYYGYHQWTAEPSRLISEMTIRHLRASRRFGLVDQGDRIRMPDAILQGTVVAIEEVDLGDHWDARLALRLVLRSAQTGEILDVHAFDRAVQCKDRHPKEVAAGVSQILAEELAKLAPRIIQKLVGAQSASQPSGDGSRLDTSSSGAFEPNPPELPAERPEASTETQPSRPRP